MGHCVGVATDVVSAPHSLRISRRWARAASGVEFARRNVNTGRPISLIGPIRSNARHSPTGIYRCRKVQQRRRQRRWRRWWWWRYTFLNRGIVRNTDACKYARVRARARVSRVCWQVPTAGTHAGCFVKDIGPAFRVSLGAFQLRGGQAGQIDGVVIRSHHIIHDGLSAGRRDSNV